MIRAIRNLHIPINRLPPEVLSRVLQHRGCGQDLVVATHVCQYWRSTLVSCPSLWTSIQLRSTGDVDRALAYLQRSKSVTVDISVTLDSPQDPNVLRHFAPHISRTRSFTMGGSFDVHMASSLLLCNPASSLERLKICAEKPPVRAIAINNFLGQQAPSLRSAIFDGICPVLQSPFPLPSLTKLDLRLPRHMGSLSISSLLRLCAGCPRLQKMRINIACETIQDVSFDQTASLEELEELEYTTHTTVGRFLPFLKLPHLNLLLVSSSRLDKLADLLPHSGHILLSGATTLSHFYDGGTQEVELSGKGFNASFTVYDNGEGATSAGWFSDEKHIPFGRIEELEFVGFYISADFPIHLFKNARKYRVTPWDGRIAESVLRLLYPCPETGVPCPSLRAIECTFRSPPESYMRSLISLAREREQAGYRLEFIHVMGGQQLDPYLEGRLRKHVGELFVCISEEEGEED